MKAFSELLDKLYFTNSNLAKSAFIRKYLAETPDPDRGWAIAAIAGTLSFEFFKRNLIKELIIERVDPVLFALSYDYVGEMSETVSHLWPDEGDLDSTLELPSLNEVVEHFQIAKRAEVKPYLVSLLDKMSPSQRWALIKLGTRGLRVGVSARSLKKILAEYGSVDINEIEMLWHGLTPPYTELLTWLEGTSDKPDVSDKLVFHPVMLAHPINDNELTKINAEEWIAEWKYDGIRVQLVCKNGTTALFSRTGDNISHSFPDLLEQPELLKIDGVFDGELLVLHETDRKLNIASFNQLQQRLNKKKPSKKLMQDNPAAMMFYDLIRFDAKSLTNEPLQIRRQQIKRWIDTLDNSRLMFSESLLFSDLASLSELRESASKQTSSSIEGLMLKRQQSLYVPGRPKGQWYKWKRDPMLIDAVIMYAQRGHGKRSSFYSDYTFGLWQDETLLPIGKAYSGFTDEELKQLDRWVRNNTLGRFGPVKEVAKELVFEVAFDSVHESKRHKSGIALRFPRIHRIRWDKPALEADQLTTLKNLVK